MQQKSCKIKLLRCPKKRGKRKDFVPSYGVSDKTTLDPNLSPVE